MRNQGYIFFLLAFFAALGGAAWYVDAHDLYGQYRDYHQREEDLSHMRMQVQALEETLNKTRRQVDNLHNKSIEMEKAIRSMKGMVRDGEKVYVLEAESSGQGAAPAGGALEKDRQD